MPFQENCGADDDDNGVGVPSISWEKEIMPWRKGVA
jgi:hypothetical protein